MSCNKCETKKCSCGQGSTPVMPPSECNTPTCPTPAPCSEIVPTACIQYVGEAKLCGEDEVFAEGDTIGVIEEKIVDYFCERLSNVSQEVTEASIIVTQVDCGEDTVYETGDTIIEALEKTVGYFCTELSDINDIISGLATVASSGAYSDLTGLPTALSDFSNDLLTTDELAAINGANTPSALNVFATINDIPAVTNLYNANGTLPEDRTVTGGGNDLSFVNLNKVSFSTSLSTSEIYIDETQVYLWAKGNVNGTYTGIYTDTKGVQCNEDSVMPENNRLTLYADSGGVFVKHGVGISSIPASFDDRINIFSENVVDLFGNNGVRVISPSASAIDTAFAVRNNVDNANLFRIKANGFINSLATPNYADDTAADADVNLVSGDFYTTTAGGRAVFKKP
jgi:hypothetical protein